MYPLGESRKSFPRLRFGLLSNAPILPARSIISWFPIESGSQNCSVASKRSVRSV